MRSWLRRGPAPTAIFAENDLMAIGAIGAVRAWGASVPDDVSIIGLDGTSIASLTDPAFVAGRFRIVGVRKPVA